MPRVLMFAPAFAPSYFSEGLVNSKLALAMLAAGWEVEVISMTSDHSMSYAAGWPQLWAPLKGLRRDVQPAARGGGWRRLKSLSADVLRSGQWIRGVHWGPAASELALRLHREKPFDLVLSRSTSCSAHLPALLFCREADVKWIANWNDPPPYLFPPPYCYQVSKLNRLGMRRYFRAVAAEASFNTFPSLRLFRHLQAEFGISDEQRVRVVPHIGLVDYKPRRQRPEGRLRFCHAGNLSEERNPALFLQALKNVVERHRGRTEIVCEIVGVESHGLAEQIRRMELANIVRFSGATSYEESLDVLSDADVAVLIEAPCAQGIFLPSKVIDYAQLGKPILAVSPATGVMKDMLGDGRAGVHVDNRSVGAIEDGIELLVAAWGRNRLADFNPDRIWSEGSPEAVLAAIAEMMGGIEARNSR